MKAFSRSGSAIRRIDARNFAAMGFRAIAVCIDSTQSDREFAGRELDEIVVFS